MDAGLFLKLVEFYVKETIMLKRSGTEKHCGDCGKYKQAEEFKPSPTDKHRKICYECHEKQSLPVLLQKQTN